MPTWREILSAGIALFIIIAIMLLILQIVNLVKITKQKKKFSEIHLSLKPGAEVMISNGLYGKITSVKDDIVFVELAKGIEVKASRYSISRIISN
ncbi:preprotein translocase subunit YajC [Helcococcus kunzii]|mgnify:CR=1 FL=1|uniref:Preprotein translocase, YajC subunit n=1 Tax=Helcococcus kunzii ATCC 51366 TaxID=883114 RepID=H3NQ67_9FIRM|nr:preprotein translocase subunit YajC [Helcococcus kunzii]EHR32547.1 preprotein translocase, YajC subunit [Helcococcus kunzii ATCC 51366]MCT1796379.1 preprotein translocase subunit YajC [Helcococcus kunzii]MCT1989429.1 preprotein translocase subunit YajC [Helcococcus kunzii]QUY65359.1 preprotein translocase subunit YajC [Helcococcus kunzii]